MNYPALILNKNKALRNIQKMVSKADKWNVELRPHFKTHQSKEIGNWFRDHGVEAITVSSMRMAEYFKSAGWTNITIAFPVNILQAKRINQIAENIDLRVLAIDVEVIKRLDTMLTNQLGIYIDLDPGYNRSGIPIQDVHVLQSLKESVQHASNLRFEGFYAHAGHSYKSRSKEEIRKLSEPIIANLSELKAVFNDPICFGDTPSCSVLENVSPVDQVSPGNFVFYDWTQVNIQSCTVDEISIAMFCPVVSKFPERNELLIHGGAVHFSKDQILNEHDIPYFGMVAELNGKDWTKPLDGNFLKSISQEHGIVTCTPSFFDSVSIGDIIPILPIHSCLTADLMAEYITLEGEVVDHMNERVFK